jgi:hypothetical protein
MLAGTNGGSLATTGGETALPTSGTGQGTRNVQLLAGSNVTLTCGYNNSTNTVDYTIASVGGAGFSTPLYSNEVIINSGATSLTVGSFVDLGAATTVAAGSNGVSLATLAAGTALSVAAATGFSATGGTFTVLTNHATATLAYTGTSGSTITGISILTVGSGGNTTDTVGTGNAVQGVLAAPFTTPVGGSGKVSLAVNLQASLTTNAASAATALLTLGLFDATAAFVAVTQSTNHACVKLVVPTGQTWALTQSQRQQVAFRCTLSANTAYVFVVRASLTGASSSGSVSTDPIDIAVAAL